jgi:hypothetical protein
MADVLRIKRRAVGGAAGPPATLAAAELAFNEVDNTLYYGKGNNGSGVATSVVAVATVGGGAATPAINLNLQTQSTNYTISAGMNGHSVGPVTIATGAVVTIPTDSRWVII